VREDGMAFGVDAWGVVHMAGHGPNEFGLSVARAVMCQKLDRASLTAVRICQLRTTYP
jgi:hypothetical protein